MFKKGLFYLCACFVVILMIMGCQNPPWATPSPTPPTSGSISGLAVYKGQSDNSGIVISVDSVNSSGQSLSILRSLAAKNLVSRAIVAQTTTDSTGAYTLSNLAPGTYTVYASSPNSLEQAVYTGVSVSAGKDVTASELDLTATGAISGTVTLGGATTGNLGILVYIAGTSYCALTKNDGSYTISGVPVGTGYLIVASCQGYNTSSPTPVSVTSGATTAVTSISLTPYIAPATTGTVTGKATMTGQPAGANAGIFIYLTGTSYLTMTDASGAFTLSGVAPGTYTLVASSPNYSSVTTTVTVAAGSTTTATALLLGTLPTYTITYNANGATSGTVPVDSNTYLAGATATVLGNTGGLAKTGATFAGWNTTSAAKGTAYAGQSPLVMGAASVTLYAVWTTQPDLFFALTLQTSSSNPGLTIPGYWRNGTVTTLPTNTAAPNGAVNNISVIGTDIYVLGYLLNGTTSTSMIPVYWKNGILNMLTIPAGTFGNACQMTIDSSSNVFITGNITSSTNNSIPGYWENGTWTQLSITLPDGTSTSGSASGTSYTISSAGDSYLCGWLTDPVSNIQVPVYWKNGSPKVLQFRSIPGGIGGNVCSLGLSSTSVLYLTGCINATTSTVPVFWQNDGAPTALPLDGLASGGQTRGPDFIGSDIYSMGMLWGGTLGTMNYGLPAYWKNWQLQVLPLPLYTTGGASGWAYQSGGDIYIDGTLGTSNGLYIPVYWKNGSLNLLDLGGTYVGASEIMTIPNF